MARVLETFKVTLGEDMLLLCMSDTMHKHMDSWVSARHCNAEYEVHMVLEGKCRVDVEDCSFDLKKGQGILIAPGQYHQPHTESGSFLRLSLSFSTVPGALEDTLRSKVPVTQVFSLTELLEQTARGLLCESEAGESLRVEMLQAQLTALMIGILRTLALTESHAQTADHDPQHRRQDLIDDFFEQHFAEKAGQNLLAQKLHLSRRQLARTLQAYYGMGYRQKLLAARMDHAAMLLRTTQNRTSRIAELVGYDSEAAFYQAFRNHFHMTPNQYRSRFVHRKG